MTILHTPAEAPPGRHATARRITDWLDPKNVIIAVSVLTGLAQSDPLTGLAWAAEAIVFAAVIPVAYITYGIKKGQWADRHIGQRQRRLLLIPVIMASVGAGIGGMLWLDAPRPMLALVLAMLATLAVLLPITAFWKISVHTSVAAGALAILATAYGPLVWLTAPVVAVIAWSRVELRAHTLAQTIAGAVTGAVVAGLVFAAVSG
ncbi:phosphatase PAP2 family protein [Streptomyces spectabilis]|uniref:phosphatase PAP2 family protein n=1 Tax=Streptomyces spectabilis TaxID=68270 RepID=UPI0033F92FC6